MYDPNKTSFYVHPQTHFNVDTGGDEKLSHGIWNFDFLCIFEFIEFYNF